MSTLRVREAMGEIIGGVILIALGIVWAVMAGDYGLLGEGGRLAPGTLPFACGVGLAMTGAVIAVKSLLVARGGSGSTDSAVLDDAAVDDVDVVNADVLASADILDDTAIEVGAASAHPTSVEVMEDPTTLGGKVRFFPRKHPVLTVYLLVVGGVALMPVLGFAASFAVAIFAILRLVERQPFRTSIAVGVVTALLGYLLFEVIFNLPLPEPFFL